MTSTSGSGARFGADSRQLRAVAALADDTRRTLFEMACDATEPLTREQAAAAVGISRKLAAFHLDKLVQAGLLVAAYDPGSRAHRLGRAPKAYRLADADVHISIPDRRPQTLARILVDALRTAQPNESAADAADRAAWEAGHRLAQSVRAGIRRPGRLSAERALAAAERVLREQGYQPIRESPSTLRLLNCPFSTLSAEATEVVCGLNERLITGLLDGLGATATKAEAAPRPRGCCVVVRG